MADSPATKLDGPLREQLARALLGLTHREAGRVLRKTALAQGGLDAGCVQAVVSEKRQAVRKSGVLEFCEPDVSFNDVGGLENLKEWFTARREAFGPRGVRFGLSAPKGAVLAGIPGCGKSLSAKALAADWGVPLLRLDMGRIRGSRLGESEGRLRAALQLAETSSPCVLWIDELEKAFAGMGQAQDSGVSQRLFGAFLSWLEERRSSVFVVATANDVTKLPAEFARKGRFDEMFFVGLPSETERESIWRVHLKRPRKIGKIDVDRLVTISEGRTGAEIAEAVISAMYRAFDAEERPVSQEDLEIALQDGVPMCVSHAGALRKLTAWGLQYARQASR
jgi:SpoVK/Ycf46/Vps4 family AAA+-type ATPase